MFYSFQNTNIGDHSELADSNSDIKFNGVYSNTGFIIPYS